MNETVEQKGDRYNKIINGIMSGQTPVLLLCQSTPSYLGFFPDLSNNYRTVYVYAMQWESQCDFLLGLAEKVISDKNELKMIESFCRCRTADYEKKVLQYIFDAISKVQNDCLAFFCGLETIESSFDMSLFEYMIDNRPDNLKLVFCSTVVPHMSYRIDDKSFPRIIVCDKENDYVPFNEHIFTDGFLTEQQKIDLYFLSSISFIHRDYVENISPELNYLLDNLARNYRSSLLRLGSYYCFHSDFRQILRKYLPSEPVQSKSEDPIEFFMQNGAYAMALEKAICRSDRSIAERAAIALIKGDRDEFLFDLVRRKKTDFPDSPLFQAIKKYNEKEYADALDRAKQIRDDFVRSKFRFKFSLFTEDRPKAFRDFCNEVDRVGLLQYATIISDCTYAEEKKLGTIPGLLIQAEELYRNGARDIAFFHFISKIYAATGNYSDAKRFLIRIKEVCPFYSYSFAQSWPFFFNMPMETVEEYAANTGNELLECCGCLYRNNTTQALDCLRRKGAPNDYSVESLLTLALQGLFYAEAGNPDFGRTLSLLYAVSCEREKREESSLFYISLAYCDWRLRNNTRALAWLKKSKSGGNTDAFFAFFAKALEINCNMERERSVVLEKKMTDLLNVAIQNGYDNAIIVLKNCFLPIIALAERKEIHLEYVSRLYAIMKNTNESQNDVHLQVKYFGYTAVFKNKREIAWKTKKCKELFLLYLLYPEGVERSVILSEIWSDYVYASAVNNLKTTNNMIRKTLRDNNVPFEFGYVNGKYRLTIGVGESDYENYKTLLGEFESATELRKRMIFISRLYVFADGDFAPDCDLPVFKKIRDDIKQELSLHTEALVINLIKENDYVNAKRFLLRLEKLGVYDCEKLKIELNKLV